MENKEIKNKIQLLRSKHKIITEKRRQNNDDKIEDTLFHQHQILLKQISELEWKLKSSREKNEHRKTVLNMGRKWLSMGGTDNSTEDNGKLEHIISLCDSTLALLEIKDLDIGLKDKLLEMLEYIDSKKNKL